MRISDWSSDVCSSDLATMPRIISNKDGTNAPIIKRLPVIGDPSPRMCGLNLTGMCWSPRLGQENSWMQPDDPPIETLRRFGFRTASVRGRLHRVLSALHTGAGLRFEIGRAPCRERVC